MITIVAGSRSIDRYSHVASAIAEAPWAITRILSGGARGVDEFAVSYANLNNIPCDLVTAFWNEDSDYNAEVGKQRYSEMLKKAEGIIVIWDGKSRGTAHLIELAKQSKLKLHIKKV